MTVTVHCFRCDAVVEADATTDDPLWCAACDDTVLGPPTAHGERLVWWSASGLELAPPDDDPDEEDRPPRARSLGGSMLGAGMLGLQQALFGPIDDETPMVHVDDEPEPDEDVELHLDDAPNRSWIRFRRDR